jgi:hypothetical protein
VVETVPRGSIVRLHLNDKELARAIQVRFEKTSGEPMADKECWTQLVDLMDEKRIRLEPTVCTADDGVMSEVIERAMDAAHECLRKMEPQAALEGAVPPKKRQGTLFPEADGYEERPKPIYRKPKRKKAGRK